MAIRVRRGNEADFDANKMLPGEWAVSLDTKYVRMCFAPGVCLRMATYEGFESDMERVEAILEEVETIDEAIKVIYEEFKQAAIDVEIVKEAARTSTEMASAAEGFANSASESAADAQESASNATRSEESALLSAEAAGLAKDAAKTSEENASASAIVSAQKADAAAESAESASDSEENASAYSLTAKSYAVGGTGTRENEDFDNAKYYMEQAKSISDIKGGLVPMGTITFSQLSIENSEPGYMYNISNEFTTNASFKEGAGKTYPPGTNVYLTADGYWDCFGGSPFVSGVKGSAESSYRRGNVEITAANIGLGNVDNTADKDKTVKHANTAGSATSDGNGNEIAKTYAKASDFSNVDNTADKDKNVKYAETAGSASANDVYDWAKEISKPSYSKSEVGLSNVPNVTTNDQTPTYSAASSLTNLSSGEKLSVAFGKISKAISTLISHISTVASSSVLGHVKLSDTYTSKVSNGAAANGLGASQNALYNAYNTLLGKFDGLDTSTVRYVSDESDADYDWVQVKDADGSWVNWMMGNLNGLYVIRKGVLSDEFVFSAYNHKQMYVEQNDGYVTFNKPNANLTGALVCSGIDFTPYTKFKFTVTESTDQYNYVAICGNTNTGDLKSQTLTPSAKEYEVNISNISGVNYIIIVLSTNKLGRLSMTDMHFE